MRISTAHFLKALGKAIWEIGIVANIDKNRTFSDFESFFLASRDPPVQNIATSCLFLGGC
jgi:hypothetical protein